MGIDNNENEDVQNESLQGGGNIYNWWLYPNESSQASQLKEAVDSISDIIEEEGSHNSPVQEMEEVEDGSQALPVQDEVEGSQALPVLDNEEGSVTSPVQEQEEVVVETQPSNIKVLFAAFEASPFMKTGGLGDVAGALPIYLNDIGVDTRVIMPLFSSIKEEYRREMRKIAEFYVPFSWRNQYLGVYEYKNVNTIIYFLDNEYYFKRDKAYGYFDDGERIAFFSKALLETLVHIDFDPDVLHLNDWHTALSAVYLREMYQGLEKFRRIRTVFTVHNLKFQGKFDPKMLKDPIDLYRYDDARRQLLQKDAVNYMMGALNYADYLTTVSPTYAEEVKNSFFGEGLEEIFNRRASIFRGIVNGIDYYVYNPKTDKNIFVNYDINTLEEKKKNKIGIQRELGLNEDENVCVIGLISRLTEQKGMDLLTTIFEEMINTLHVQFVLLGQGDRKYEDAFRYFENKYRGRVSSSICFSEERSRRIYAASDLFLVPSVFEPCGLSQLIAMRYLSLPIVRKTGGLKDTVEPYNKFTKEGTGFAFQNINAHDLLFTIKDAVALYYDDRETFNTLIRNASEKDYSWASSAREYEKMYRELTGK